MWTGPGKTINLKRGDDEGRNAPSGPLLPEPIDMDAAATEPYLRVE